MGTIFGFLLGHAAGESSARQAASEAVREYLELVETDEQRERRLERLREERRQAELAEKREADRAREAWLQRCRTVQAQSRKAFAFNVAGLLIVAVATAGTAVYAATSIDYGGSSLEANATGTATHLFGLAKVAVWLPVALLVFQAVRLIMARNEDLPEAV